MLMAPLTKGIGRKMIDMVKATKYGLMDPAFRVIFFKTKCKVKESIFGLMDVFLTVIGKTI